MSQQAELEARLLRLEGTLKEVEDRLRTLEHGAGLARGTSAMQDLWPQAAPRTRSDLVTTLSLIGRSLVIVAGAYLLRALAESGSIGRETGAILGIVYAISWTLVAYQRAPHQALSATFFAALTVLIGFPLLWEVTIRFKLLTAPQSALALTLLVGVVLGTAWRRNLRALAWLTTLSACGFATVLLVMTSSALPFTAFLILLGVATLWLGYDREWTLLRWVVALFADVAVLALIGRALATPPRDTPSMVMAVQLLLLVGYLVSIVVRTLVRGRDVLPFEAVQTAVMLLVGLAGAIVITQQTGASALMLAPSLLALSLACYVVAFADRWKAHRTNRLFYSSLALVFALTGCALVLDGAVLGTAWAFLAVAVGWVGCRYQREMLAAHSVVYVTAAAVATGLVTTTLVGLFAAGDATWSPMGWVGWSVVVAIAVCWSLVASTTTDASPRVATVLRLVLAAMAVGTVAGVGVVVAHSVVESRATAPLLGGIVATLRTAVFAGIAVAVAWLGRRAVTREFGALLYPVLAWGALKLLVEDVRTSPPALLVLAFTLYGGALILGPRIAKTS